MTAATVRFAATVLAATSIATVSVWAQTSPPPMVTDRPSFTSAARVVGPRAMQLESGLGVVGDQPGIDLAGPVEFTTLALPNALLRIGLTRRLELRAAMTGWIRTTIDRPLAEPSSALSPANLAGEYQFAAQEGFGADLAVIAGVSVPTQDFGAGDNTLDPFAQFVWSRDLTDTINLGGMAAWSLPSSAGHRFESFSASLVFGHPLGGRWSAFWEAVAGYQDLDDDRVAWAGNVGVLRTVGDDVQLDAYLGRGLNHAAADWAVGAGVSVRFHR